MTDLALNRDSLMLRMVQFLILMGLLAGCSRLLLSIVPPPRFSLTSPVSNSVYDSSVQQMPLKGKCHGKDAAVLIIEPIREIVPCNNGEWSFTFDINILPEGEFKIKIGSLDESVTYDHRATKKFHPSYLTVAQSERPLSALTHITHSDKSDLHQVLAYSSDEACQPSNCSTSNIMVRLRSEDYLKAYQVTRDLFIDSTQPLITFLPSGDLRIIFLSSDTQTGPKNLFYRDFAMATKTVSPAVQITQSTDGVSAPRLVRIGGVNHLFYLSTEYCALNGCASTKISWRKSNDSYQSVEFPTPGTPDQCQVSALMATSHSPSGQIHLAYALSSAGTCTVPNRTIEYIKGTSGSWTAIRFLDSFFGGGAMAVDDAGTSYIFSRNSGGSCGTWVLRFRSSLDNFTGYTVPANGCGQTQTSPGDAYGPALILNDAGDVQLVFEKRYSQPGADASLQVSSSTDLFSTSVEVIPNEFAGHYAYPKIVQTSTGWDLFVMQTSGTNSGLKRVTLSGAVQKQINLTGPTTSLATPVELENGKLGIISASTEWCQQNGCENLNYVLKIPNGQSETWLTKISQENLEIDFPRFALAPTGPHRFFYSSNELDPLRRQIAVSSAADGYSSRTSIPPLNGKVSNSVSDLEVHPSGTIHLATIQTPNADITYRNSLDGFSSGTRINTGDTGSSNYQIRVRDDEHIAVAFGATGGSGWQLRIRWSLDSYASEANFAPDGDIKYSGRSLVWNPSNNLEVFSASDGNGDGRKDLVVRTSADSYATTTILTTYSNKSLCHQGKDSVIAKYDPNGLIYVLYSAKEDGTNICRLYLKRSDDWSRSWRIYPDAIINYLGAGLILRDSGMPTVCARSDFSLHCFETAGLSRVLD